MSSTASPRAVSLVVIGGTVGTLARYGLAEALSDYRLFPLATFIVNVTGSLALGLLLGLLAVRTPPRTGAAPLRLLFGTGLLGGYTTYSALAVETDALLRDDHAVIALGYASATVVAGLLAAGAGVAAARVVTR